MELGIGIGLGLVVMVVGLVWGAWKLAQPAQLRQELQVHLERVLGAHTAVAMKNRELQSALRAEVAHVQQLQRQLQLLQRHLSAQRSGI